MKKLSILFLIVLCLTSCFSTRTNVRGFQGVQGEEYRYARGKQCYLFWGLLPLGRTNVDSPADGVCQIRTYHNFGDFLVTLLTGGIFEMQTIKVIAKRPVPQYEYQPAYQQAPPAQQPAPVVVQPVQQVSTAQQNKEVQQLKAQPQDQSVEQPAQQPIKQTTAPKKEIDIYLADLNDDGMITAEEAQLYNQLFKQADSNGNGKIDSWEEANLKRMLERAKK